MDRLFLDANVLFSAAYREDAGLALFWNLPKVVLLSSTYAVEEARVNLDTHPRQIRLAKLVDGIKVISALFGAAACRCPSSGKRQANPTERNSRPRNTPHHWRQRSFWTLTLAKLLPVFGLFRPRTI